MEEKGKQKVQQQELIELLNEFQGVFGELVSLPPKRLCNHQVILKDGT